MLGVIVPFVLLLVRKVRTTKDGPVLFVGARAARLRRPPREHRHHEHGTLAGEDLLPVLAGARDHAGLAAFGFVAFALVASYFNVFGEEPHTHDTVELPVIPLRALASK